MLVVEVCPAGLRSGKEVQEGMARVPPPVDESTSITIKKIGPGGVW
jgi:hypothetical protein